MTREERITWLELELVRAIDASGCDGDEVIEAIGYVAQRAVATSITGSLAESMQRWIRERRLPEKRRHAR